MSGNDFEKAEDFWEAVGKKAGIPMWGEISTANANKSVDEAVTTTTMETFLGNKDKVIKFFKENEKVLL